MQQDGVSAASGEGYAEELPSLGWSEEDLRYYLAQVWGQRDPLHLRVIGRLQLAEGKTFGFLLDLHHAETGSRLPPPLKNASVRQAVFVPA